MKEGGTILRDLKKELEKKRETKNKINFHAKTLFFEVIKEGTTTLCFLLLSLCFLDSFLSYPIILVLKTILEPHILLSKWEKRTIPNKMKKKTKKLKSSKFSFLFRTLEEKKKNQEIFETKTSPPSLSLSLTFQSPLLLSFPL